MDWLEKVDIVAGYIGYAAVAIAFGYTLLMCFTDL